ncbi:MAG TPA: hypothetical protein H9761_15930 [Candidatus Eisenbergiella merdavium]|uniref:Uncharacterized protein n=1 Tax=Candidatus Eisenbergiella merdavium TaxID=2838551 RepID=A0A9D2NJN9_9FIRM|nr:hypothetical protein [Candidatus Eisenbergiella merdavium]
MKTKAGSEEDGGGCHVGHYALNLPEQTNEKSFALKENKGGAFLSLR